MNLILNKSVSKGVSVTVLGAALQCDVPECSLPWKIKQGSLEILNNSQTFGRGQRLGAGNDQGLSGGEIGLESLISHKPPGFLFEGGGGRSRFPHLQQWSSIQVDVTPRNISPS